MAGTLNCSPLQDAFARRDFAALEAMCRQNPEHAPSHLFAGIALFDCGRYAEALPCFEAVLRLQQYNDLAAAYRALVMLASGRDEEGVEVLRTRGFADNQQFLVRLTEWVETQWLESGRYFEPRPLDLEPAPAGSRRVAERRASTAFHRRDWRSVVSALDHHVRQPNADPNAVYAAALAAEMLRDNERALAYLSYLSADLDGAAEAGAGPLPDIIRAARARNLVRLRHFRQAAEDLSRVLITGPEDFGVNYFLGVLCLAAGQRDRARDMFARAYRDYLVDTLEYQFAALKTALLGRE
ncbi:MAG: tetratricopeptide repeat protein [Candidatus Sumerlaeaceae bacterium]|nr:tetratricopeptide repeat protein [Candidatus Sumerlaeaceae bacterium]